MFLKRIRFVFPDRPIVDIPDSDAIFHTVFDLNDRFQIPGAAHLYQGCKTAARAATVRTGVASTTTRVASWWRSRTIPTVGDAWEFADDPNYPEKFSGLAIRIGVDYVVYAMTH